MAISEGVQIFDIRKGASKFDILQDIRKGLRPDGGGERTLPTLLLYDEAGLRLFEKITYLEEYYLTNAEIDVLKEYADRIAQRIPNGSVVVELGSGNLRKVNILLQALEHAEKDTEYYALDLSLSELKRTFSEIPATGYRHVKCFGLYGTYDDGLEWLKTSQISGKPKTILWLGSSLGNFRREDAGQFLAKFQDALQPADNMLIGIDSCKDPDRVYHAYNDKENVTHSFILNGLAHANRILDQEDNFKLEDWKVIGEYDIKAGRHHAFLSPIKDVVVDGVAIPKGERIRIEESYKYSRDEIERLWKEAKLVESGIYSNGRGDYGLHLVSKPKFSFPLAPEVYAASPVPSLSDWQQLWTAWDAVTRDMIPEEELLSKPIKLRNACIFYLGHIPTFLDIHLSRATGGKDTDPAYYRQIFERGIDPDVDDPSLCHDHSEIPDTWPPVDEIERFQSLVRKRVEELYVSGSARQDRRVGRALWIGFEHEAMHLETLLYMLIQSERINPPPGINPPDFEVVARQSARKAVPNEWFSIPEMDMTIGMDDPEDLSGPERYFGWDNEKPIRSIHVGAFQAKARPITNGEYAEYLEKTGKTDFPASWYNSPHSRKDSVHASANGHPNGTNGVNSQMMSGKYVRTVYGPVPLKYAANWPVVASYDELNGCAQWMGGRIPTMEEVRSIYNYVDRSKSKEFGKTLGRTIPAVNGHLINDGVQESPPSHHSMNDVSKAASGPVPRSLFIDLEGANVGFQNWHPVSVAEKGGSLSGQGDLGGVWEWTSTVLEKHKGFEAMVLYPGYTADFFDGKHNVVLGGSWATHPRLAGRKSFVNWYQRNYPYVWAGARLVRDT
ncbi:hypothetical protein GQ43DRAFT_367436 [Delitschia confertaspora ATCC 74209]|uniref:Methyltransferase n=1 Tax=Delitschia confertaspora ATCC 74209 TaxID=1513339 RepID=A0A9P4JTV5_9PLEO|nr:hypothetical protein GQ43DRAFT_367436 [Delitschia confertaspora ATCC 74209]